MLIALKVLQATSFSLRLDAVVEATLAAIKEEKLFSETYS